MFRFIKNLYRHGVPFVYGLWRLSRNPRKGYVCYAVLWPENDEQETAYIKFYLNHVAAYQKLPGVDGKAK